jgi:hypothetical protein
MAVPERLEHRIGEPGIENVLDWLLAQVMVDAKDRIFREMLEQRVVECLRRLAIAAKGLLDNEARVDVEPGLGESRNHDAKQAGGNRQIMQRPLGAVERLLQLRKSLRIVVVAVDIPHKPQELIEPCSASRGVLLDTVFRPFPELFDCPPGLGDSDDGDVDAFTADQAQQRWENLLEGEIAGSAEEHQGVGLGGLHLISCGISVGFGPIVGTPARGLV